MKVIIAGGRNISETQTLEILNKLTGYTHYFEQFTPIKGLYLFSLKVPNRYKPKQIEFWNNVTEIVCGMAKGVDTHGEKFAKINNIPVKYFPANWNEHGKRAGFIRNAEMGDYADALILIWDGKSKGSAHMKKYAKSVGLPILEFVVNSV